jgi:hypothetical protein
MVLILVEYPQVSDLDRKLLKKMKARRKTMPNNDKVIKELVKFVRQQNGINQSLERFVKEQRQLNVNSEGRFQKFQKDSEMRFRTFYHMIISLQKRVATRRGRGVV